MKTAKFILLGTAFLTIFFLYFPTQTSSKQINGWKVSQEAPKLALLVGVNEYQDYGRKSIRHLKGTHNDVGMMKDLLTDVYKFQEKPVKGSSEPCGGQTKDSSVRTLCSKNATHEGIIKTFQEHLIKKAKEYKEANKVTPDKGATVVFYYSGHGSKLPDEEPNKDESDGIDETIVPHDSDRDGIKDIRDDEFDELYKELSKYTANITFIFDSCHSGSVTRGGVSKSVERDIKGSSNSRGDTGLDDALMSSGSGNNYVTISGSLPNEESQEYWFYDQKKEKDIPYGALTFYLVQQLRANPDATYREIMNVVQTAVVGMKKRQTPQAEGAIDRIVFGSTNARGKTPIFVKDSKIVTRKIDDKDVRVIEVKMDVGTIVGAQQGGVINVYQPKSRELADKDKIATGSIVFADAFSSTADVTLLDGSARLLPDGARVMLVTPYFGDEKRKVAIDSIAEDPSMKMLSNRLKENDLLEIVESKNLLKSFSANNDNSSKNSSSQWDLAVIKASYKDYLYGIKQAIGSKNTSVPKDDEPVFFVADRTGMPLYNFWVRAADEGAADEIKNVLEQHVRIENLRTLVNSATDLDKQFELQMVRLRGAKIIDKAQNKCEVVEDAGNRSLHLKEGDPFYLKMKNNSGEPLYIYLYSIATDGKVNLLYPESGSNESLKPGIDFSTFGAKGCRGIYQVSENSPAGKETLKMIISSEKFDASILTSPSLAKGTGRGGGVLAKLLAQTMTNSRSGHFLGETSNWTTKQIDFEITPSAEDN